MFGMLNQNVHWTLWLKRLSDHFDLQKATVDSNIAVLQPLQDGMQEMI